MSVSLYWLLYILRESSEYECYVRSGKYYCVYKLTYAFGVLLGIDLLLVISGC